MTVHTGDLNRAILAALHRDSPHADSVSFKVRTRHEDGTPVLYWVTVSRDGAEFTSHSTNPAVALERAMDLLRAAAGAGSTRVVEFASIEPMGEVQS